MIGQNWKKIVRKFLGERWETLCSCIGEFYVPITVYIEKKIINEIRSGIKYFRAMKNFIILKAGMKH